MKMEVNGIIVQETDLSNSDKLVKILTSEEGLISAIAKNSKTIKNRLGGMVQLFSYGTFTLYSGKYGYIVNDLEIKELFLGLRDNLEILSLAQYFCQLCIALRPESNVSEEVLRVILNCLHYLCKKTISVSVIKSIFELRMCALCGYMPQLVSCSECHTYESESMFFIIESGKLFCKTCLKNNNAADIVAISNSLLCALRHIVYSSIDKLFKFSISEETAEYLNCITEKYVKTHVYGNFKSLDFYKSLISF